MSTVFFKEEMQRQKIISSIIAQLIYQWIAHSQRVLNQNTIIFTQWNVLVNVVGKVKENLLFLPATHIFKLTTAYSPFY